MFAPKAGLVAAQQNVQAWPTQLENTKLYF
jgi:hypothetical protein